MGSGSSQTSNQQQSGVTAPWAAQAPFLKNAFKTATDQYNTSMNTGPYSGDYVAPATQQQYDAYGNAYNQATGTDQARNDLLANTGTSLIAPGMAGTNSALSGMTDFANTNPTAGNIANANEYVKGFDVPGAVQSAMLNANQEASDVTLPSLYRGAAGSGNLNSDRTALAEGVVKRGLAQKAAGLSADLTNSNYSQGLNLSTQGNAQRLQDLSQLGSLGLNTTQQGTSDINAAIGNQGTLNDRAIQAAGGVQGLNQGNLNNLIQQYTGKQGYGWDQLSNLMRTIGGNNWGSQSSGTRTSTDMNNPSGLQNASSIAGILGSFFKSGK